MGDDPTSLFRLGVRCLSAWRSWRLDSHKKGMTEVSSATRVKASRFTGEGLIFEFFSGRRYPRPAFQLASLRHRDEATGRLQFAQTRPVSVIRNFPMCCRTAAEADNQILAVALDLQHPESQAQCRPGVQGHQHAASKRAPLGGRRGLL